MYKPAYVFHGILQAVFLYNIRVFYNSVKIGLTTALIIDSDMPIRAHRVV